jgi:hypothetical protein
MPSPRVKSRRAESSPSATATVAESAEDLRPNSRRPFRILALDGGPAALLETLLLSGLEDLVPGFLENIDLIAGTSAGAITGLMLATRENPAHMLPVAENFWLNGPNYYKNSLFGYLKALFGLGAINDDTYVRQFLEQRGVLAGRTLRDLAKKVILTSFEVNPVRQAAGVHGPLNWQPKIFHNLAPDADDLDVLAVDAALSSSASPICTPIHQGRVDGGLVSNNPSMIAVAQILREAARPVPTAAMLPGDHHGVVLLSVAGGRAHESLDVTDNSWGYLPWLVNPFNPLLLLNAFLSGAAQAVNLEAAELLDKPNFCRVDPYYTEPGLLPFVQADPKKQQQTAECPETHELLQDAARWLRQTGWIRTPEPAPTDVVAPGA